MAWVALRVRRTDADRTPPSVGPIMQIFVLFLRLLLAGTFVLAAAGKVSRPSDFRKALAGFGMAPALARWTAVLIPAVEFGTAAMLIVTRLAIWGGIAAVALLLTFTAAIAVNLAYGRKPDCHCFGNLRVAPIGPAALVRNFAFTAAASCIVWQAQSRDGVTSLMEWQNGQLLLLIIVIAVLTVAVVTEGWFIFHLLGQHGRLLLRLDDLERRLQLGMSPVARNSQTAGLPVGAPAPVFEAVALAGNRAGLDDLRGLGRRIMLVFSDVHCGPCNALLPHVASWQRNFAEILTIVVVSRGSVEDAPKFADHNTGLVIIEQEHGIAERYRIPATPSAVLIDAEGAIADSLAVGPQSIADLVSRLTVVQIDPGELGSNRNGANGQHRPALLRKS